MVNTDEERNLLAKLLSGALDGIVGNKLTSTGGSTSWNVIENGIPIRYKQGPGGKFFNGKENERFDGVLHTLQKWITDGEKLEFLQKYGWLIGDEEARAYSTKFKPKR